jgi:hypothetical protein
VPTTRRGTGQVGYRTADDAKALSDLVHPIVTVAARTKPYGLMHVVTAGAGQAPGSRSSSSAAAELPFDQ